MRTRQEATTSTPKDSLSPLEVKRLSEIVVAGERLRRRLRSFGNRLTAAEPESVREVLRSRIECILHDQIGPAVRDLEAAQAEATAEPEP